MYRVLIADDESIIREGIKCLFDWESLGYTIAGEAANGETAYQADSCLTAGYRSLRHPHAGNVRA